MRLGDAHELLAQVEDVLSREATLDELWPEDPAGTRVLVYFSDGERVMALSPGPDARTLRFEVGDGAGYTVSEGTITFESGLGGAPSD